jgi:hypothetical protein
VQARPFDSAVVKQLEDAPVLMNLARVLALQTALLEDTPMPPGEAAIQQEYVQDLTEMLRTILCL